MIAATRNFGRNAFDLPVAALAAIAVAVFAFAIPADALGHAVAATGLPSLLTAAEPPLGMKARAAIAIVGALAAFGMVFFLMRRLDRPAKSFTVSAFEESEEDAPRLRRRDSHPDAPPRPIFAARDLGEPAPPAQPTLRATTPNWMEEAEARLNVPEPVVAPAPVMAPTPEPEPVIEAEPEPAELPLVEASLPELMARLEQGLARRRDRQMFTRPPEPQPTVHPQVFPEANDDRLQSAIESLQRLAGRAD